MSQAPTQPALASQVSERDPEVEKYLSALLAQRPYAADMRKVEKVTTKLSFEKIAAFDALEQSILLAEAVDQLRKALSDDYMETVVLRLMNSPLGFRCDRPNKRQTEPYTREEVREALIQALFYGARLIGNEFNIMSERCYLTREFFERKVREHPDLANLTMGFETSQEAATSVRIKWVAEFTLKGEPRKLEQAFTVRRNEGQTVEACVGKGRRKMLAHIWMNITGSRTEIPEGEMDEPVKSTDAERRKPDPDLAAAVAAKQAAEHAAARGDETPVDTAKAPEPEPKTNPKSRAKGGPITQADITF